MNSFKLTAVGHLARNPELVAWMNEQRRLGERAKDCVECGRSFTFRNSLAQRCPGCRHQRKLKQRREKTTA